MVERIGVLVAPGGLCETPVAGTSVAPGEFPTVGVVPNDRIDALRSLHAEKPDISREGLDAVALLQQGAMLIDKKQAMPARERVGERGACSRMKAHVFQGAKIFNQPGTHGSIPSVEITSTSWSPPDEKSATCSSRLQRVPGHTESRCIRSWMPENTQPVSCTRDS